MILITGDMGFIGTHFKEAVKNEEGILMDIKRDSVGIMGITPESLKGVDTIFHFAALPKVPISIEDPIATHVENVNATLHLLWCAKEAGVKRFIYSASSSVYGVQNTLPLTEDMKPNPMSPYAAQKLMGEYYCKIFSELYGIETVCLRYFNVYGENMPTDGYAAAIAKFKQQKADGKKLTVYGGEQTRDFTYVGDVVEANLLAWKSKRKWNGEIINIGSGKNYSITDIAKAIGGIISFYSPRKGEAQDTRADISKANELLGWKPKTDVIKWLKCK